MRARLLHPGFWSNEILAELPYEGRLLFAGLWNLADREGRLEDRPRRIKGELFRYDALTGDDVDRLLAMLADRGFIIRYEAGGGRYIQICAFTKHQHVHIREPRSIIPAPGQHCASTVPAPGQHRSGPADINTVRDTEADRVNPPVSPLAADAASGGASAAAPPPEPEQSTTTEQPAAAKPARAKPVPETFTVTDEMRRLAVSYGVPAAAIDYETEKFLDHFRAKGERKLDWIAAWRNWMRRAAEMTMHAPARASPNGARASPDRDAAAKAKLDAFLRIARGEE